MPGNFLSTLYVCSYIKCLELNNSSEVRITVFFVCSKQNNVMDVHLVSRKVHVKNHLFPFSQ